MPVPGYTAAASIYQTSNRYRLVPSYNGGTSQDLVPALKISPRSLGWSPISYCYGGVWWYCTCLVESELFPDICNQWVCYPVGEC